MKKGFFERCHTPFVRRQLHSHDHDYRRNAARLAILRCSYVPQSGGRTEEGGGRCALPLYVQSVLLQIDAAVTANFFVLLNRF